MLSKYLVIYVPTNNCGPTIFGRHRAIKMNTISSILKGCYGQIEEMGKEVILTYFPAQCLTHK